MPAPTFQAIKAKMTPDYSLLYSPPAPVSAAVTSAKMSPDYTMSPEATSLTCHKGVRVVDQFAKLDIRALVMATTTTKVDRMLMFQPPPDVSW